MDPSASSNASNPALKGGVYIGSVILIAVILFSTCLKRPSPPELGGPEETPIPQPPQQDGDSWQTFRKELRSREDAERVLRQIMKDYGVSALSVAIRQNPTRNWQDMAQSYFFSLGVQDPTTGRALDGSTVFRAGILSQPLFGYLILRLANAQRIDIDRPLHQYLDLPLTDYPEYADLKGDSRWKKLTARLMLAHRSGLINSRQSAPDKRLKFVSAPGKEYGYSEEGFRLLQFVLEKMFRRPLNEIAAIVVYSRLSLSHSSFVWEPRFDGHMALPAGLDIAAEKEMGADAAGSLITTVSDFLAFTHVVLDQRGMLNSIVALSYFMPEIQIRSSRIAGAPIPGEVSSNPKGLAWCQGWAEYGDPNSPTYFLGRRENGYEVYAAHYSSRRTSICIMGISSGDRSFTARILEELLGDTSAPLTWLGFDDPTPRREKVAEAIEKLAGR
jgi:CubicO group peptidase (beta-lactamase class C family)